MRGHGLSDVPDGPYSMGALIHDVERMMAAKIYLDRIRIDASDVSDAELQRYYKDNEYRLTLPEQVRERMGSPGAASGLSDSQGDDHQGHDDAVVDRVNDHRRDQ